MNAQLIFKLKTTPAIPVKERHRLEDTLRELGYRVRAGGTTFDPESGVPVESEIEFSKQA